MHSSICICVCVCVFMCVFVYLCIYIYVSTSVYMHKHTYMCTYIYIYVYLHIYFIYTHVHTYIISVRTSVYHRVHVIHVVYHVSVIRLRLSSLSHCLSPLLPTSITCRYVLHPCDALYRSPPRYDTPSHTHTFSFFSILSPPSFSIFCSRSRARALSLSLVRACALSLPPPLSAPPSVFHYIVVLYRLRVVT